jgi:hypothetical protein
MLNPRRMIISTKEPSRVIVQRRGRCYQCVGCAGGHFWKPCRRMLLFHHWVMSLAGTGEPRASKSSFRVPLRFTFIAGLLDMRAARIKVRGFRGSMYMGGRSAVNNVCSIARPWSENPSAAANKGLLCHPVPSSSCCLCRLSHKRN